MNYYAQGGQTQGLKSLAQDLRSYGRNGDTMLAHITPQEAGILQTLGGSGTINPYTGLPEYFGFITKPITKAWKAITSSPLIKPISDAVTPVLQTLAPLAPYIAPFIPGVGPMMAAGLGALGAGFGGKGRTGFDFKRGLMGGMTAYGLSNLYSGLQAAASAGTDATASQVASSLGSGASSAPGSQAAMLAEQSAGLGEFGLKNIASSASYASPASNLIGSAAEAGAQAIAENAPNAGMFEAAPREFIFDKSLASSVPQSLQMPNLSSMPSNFATEMSNAGSGLKNLSGLGDTTMSQAAKAVGTKFGTGSAGALFMGATGMADLDAQQKYLDEQKAAGNIADTEYQANVARIQEARKRAEEAVMANPYQFAAGGEVPGYFFGGTIKKIIESTPQILESMLPPEQRAQTQLKQLQEMGIKQNILDSANQTQLQDYINAMRKKGEGEQSAYRAMINNPYGFAMGGQIDDELGGDYSAMGMDQGNLQKGLFGMGYAAGGTPRFLSGGGDGMSDSIKAKINGTQEARLADGEFVIPADVVSHLGNGSSKAGAKQLYSMMDRVRKERTGTKKQGRQINSMKYMPA
jgi:hypothetical protein